ncbi:glycosyltransferase family 4 protein [Donghicola sp. XS_ASV15]|uniref:glycosyltransferase family 4 protein n=1 Tax=Donghicola sp. XS_ASV15 TaxID=3241295 RepID=UPI0035137423
MRAGSVDGRLVAGLLPVLRKRALGRQPKALLAKMLRKHLPAGTIYVNTGHSNLSKRVVHAVRKVPDSQIAVLIHDTIPLDFPEYQAEGATERFQKFLARACREADLLIYNSEQTRADVARWCPVHPQGIVAHLGIDFAAPEPRELPEGVPPVGPYFLTVGTIEPRKAHALLLDVWDELRRTLGPETPTLLICGSRGWKNESVFNRLDALGPNDHIKEIAGLTDGAIAALMKGATALLFPSYAEGFGLPPAEAAHHITPIVCNDLPIYREFLGNIPIYAPSGDAKLWYRAVITAYENALSENSGPSAEAKQWSPPTWEAHFERVLRLI